MEEGGQKGQQEMQIQKKSSERCHVAGFRKEAASKECEQPQAAGKGGEEDSLLDP